ncbi:hypothetical protein [Marinomonas foliarum]|uniref:Uncharacterized protein n=2 Tax=root TaxID=1 RepID=A0A899ISS9_9VIRU|nr:hypothetical protein [Marinomonas foliarum]QRV22792.1 hypothetical protein JSY38_12010 [Marinomonas foliarum]QSM01485.1 hypothetical protein [Marinomonas phage MfV]
MKDQNETQTEELEMDFIPSAHDDGEQDQEDGLSLDDLLDEAEQEATQEAEPSKEEAAANRERAERLAARFNNGLWWGLSKAYPAAEVAEEKIEAGAAALVPLAEKYGDTMPAWVDDFMEKPEIKAGLYVGTAIMAARASHMAAITKAQEEAQAQTEQKQGGEVVEAS